MNALLSNIIETHNPLIMLIVKKCLDEKLRHVFAMLNRLEDVLESSSLPKQGGESMKQSKKENLKQTMKPTVELKAENESNDNVALDLKGKEKLNDERVIDDNKEEEPYEHELKRRKACEDQMDEHNQIVREVEEKRELNAKLKSHRKAKSFYFHCGLWSELRAKL
ncbi:unnamed protein product [Lactuca saligna]|uniref:Uncharacterized protein n=1 Tax=Lactuca saligna TaxID=75948 RepID=A0AA36A1W7_LACSI|nr:unnamed protein product [Lactuca saligna]